MTSTHSIAYDLVSSQVRYVGTGSAGTAFVGMDRHSAANRGTANFSLPPKENSHDTTLTTKFGNHLD
jgi:N-acetylneuraminic acid mutarotase